ncbi:MAG: pentapeptide repeat-containing protein [Methanothrix sp.]
MDRRITELALAWVLIALLLLVPISQGSDDSLKPILASDILNEIQKGEPVEYDHCIIKGDLSLSQYLMSSNKSYLPKKHVELPTIAFSAPEISFELYNESLDATLIASSIKIRDSVIEGYVDLGRSIFLNSVDFQNTQFRNAASFKRSWFYGDVNFGGSKFFSKTSFFRCMFEGNAIFYGAWFEGDTIFEGSQFNNPKTYHTTFSVCQFKGDVDFMASQFEGLPDFSGCQFNEDSDFSGSWFNNGVYFKKSKFNGMTRFSGANFNNSADFKESTFNGNAIFSGSRFNQIANFRDSQWYKEVTFNDAIFERNTSFNNSNFNGDALFLNTTFMQMLDLTRAKYNRLYIRWASINNKLNYDDTTYLSLIKNLKSLGYYEDADNSYLEYRIERRSHPWNIPGERLMKTIDWLSEWSYGYGVRPMNPLIISLVLIGIFGLYWRSKGIGHDDDVSEAKGQFAFVSIVVQKIFDALEPFIFSFGVYISGTAFFRESPDLPEQLNRPKSWTKRVYNLERFLGGILMALFLIALSSTIIKTA